MAEETQVTEQEQETQGPQGDLGDAGKRALDAERKARKAAETRLREAEAKLKEADDAGKSDLERLQGQLAEATKRAEAAESKADRFEVASAKGLSLAQARRLVGGTKEELEADADAMRGELGLDKKDEGDKQEQDKGGDRKGTRPKEDLKLGASNEEDEQPDAGKLADSLLRSSW